MILFKMLLLTALSESTEPLLAHDLFSATVVLTLMCEYEHTHLRIQTVTSELQSQ